MINKKYLNIANHYEKCLENYGDTHKGVDWPKIEDVDKRYSVMLDVIKFSNYEVGNKYNLLDFGCGAGHLLDYLNRTNLINNYIYTGMDISSKFIKLCENKYPYHKFQQLDILESVCEDKFDFTIMNGVFTEKRELSFDEMFEFFTNVLEKTFFMTKKGLAFNVMSKAVDWEREDLFHLSTDLLINFITKNLTRNFIIRNDYGLFEYTTYLYK